MPSKPTNAFAALMNYSDDESEVVQSPKVVSTRQIPASENAWNTVPKKTDTKESSKSQQYETVVNGVAVSNRKTVHVVGTTVVQKTNGTAIKESLVAEIKNIFSFEISRTAKNDMLIEYLNKQHGRTIVNYLRGEDTIMKELKKGATAEAQVVKILEYIMSIGFWELFHTTDSKYTINIADIEYNSKLKIYSDDHFIQRDDGRHINIFMAYLVLSNRVDMYTPIHWTLFSILNEKKRPENKIPNYEKTRTVSDLIKTIFVCYAAGFTPIERTVNDKKETVFEAFEWASQSGALSRFTPVDQEKIMDCLRNPPTFVFETIASGYINKISATKIDQPAFRDIIQWITIYHPEEILSCLLTNLFNTITLGTGNDNDVETTKFRQLGFIRTLFGYATDFNRCAFSSVNESGPIGRFVFTTKQAKTYLQTYRQRYNSAFVKIFTIQLERLISKVVDAQFDRELVVRFRQHLAGDIFGLLCNDVELIKQYCIKEMTPSNWRSSVSCILMAHLTKKIVFSDFNDLYEPLLHVHSTIENVREQIIFETLLIEIYKMKKTENVQKFLEHQITIASKTIEDWEVLEGDTTSDVANTEFSGELKSSNIKKVLSSCENYDDMLDSVIMTICSSAESGRDCNKELSELFSELVNAGTDQSRILESIDRLQQANDEHYDYYCLDSINARKRLTFLWTLV